MKTTAKVLGLIVATGLIGAYTNSTALLFDSGLKKTAIFGQFSTETLYHETLKMREPASIGGKVFDPLIIDTGNGLGETEVEFSSQSEGIKFDAFGDGNKIMVSWPLHPEKDMFLCLPEKGKILSIKQLFGSEKLKTLKTHRRHFLDDKDEIYSQLRLWADLNRDGIVQEKELFTLREKNIKRIHLKYREIAALDIFGNSSSQRSFVDTFDKQKRMIFNVSFNLVRN